MTFKKLSLAASAAALAVAPVGVQAADADRSAAPVSGEQELGGSGALLGALAIAILGAFIFFAADDDNPVSV